MDSLLSPLFFLLQSSSPAAMRRSWTGRRPPPAAQFLEERPNASRFHVPYRIPRRHSVAATRPRMQECVRATVKEGIDEAVAGAVGFADAVVAKDAAVEEPPALKKGGTLWRAAIVSMVKLGCATMVAPVKADVVLVVVKEVMVGLPSMVEGPA